MILGTASYRKNLVGWRAASRASFALAWAEGLLGL